MVEIAGSIACSGVVTGTMGVSGGELGGGAASGEVKRFLIAIGCLGFSSFPGIYQVIMNLYLIRLGYDEPFVGLINGLVLAGIAVFSLPASVLTNRFGHRQVMVAGLALLMTGNLMLPASEWFAPSQDLYLIVISAARGMGWSFILVSFNPLFMAILPAANRDRLFAVRSAVMTLFGFGGSLLAGFTPGLIAGMTGQSTNAPGPYRLPLIAASLVLIPGLLALIGRSDAWQRAMRTGTEPPDERATERGAGHEVVAPPPRPETMAAPRATVPVVTPLPAAGRPVSPRLSAGLRSPLAPILWMAAVGVTNACGQGVIRTFFNVYLDLELATPTATIGGLISIAELGSGLIVLIAARTALRLGRVRFISGAFILRTLFLIPFVAGSNWLGAGIGLIGIATLTAAPNPILSVYQQELVAERYRAQMQGGYMLAMGAGWALSSAGGGLIVDAFGYRSLFIVALAATFLSGAIFALHGILESRRNARLQAPTQRANVSEPIRGDRPRSGGTLSE